MENIIYKQFFEKLPFKKKCSNIVAHEEVLNFCQSVLPFVPIFTYCSCVDSQPCVHCHVIFESPRLFNLWRWISRMDCNFEGHILGHRDCIFLGQGNFYNVYIALDRNNLWYACPVIRIQIQPFWNFFFDEFGSRYRITLEYWIRIQESCIHSRGLIDHLY